MNLKKIQKDIIDLCKKHTHEHDYGCYSYEDGEQICSPNNNGLIEAIEVYFDDLYKTGES